MADISKVRMLNGTEYNYKDAKARSDIEGLKADLGAQTGLFHWNEKGFIDLSGSSVNLTPETNQGLDYAVIECTAGDKFIITARGGNKSRVWGFVDSNNSILSVSDANADVESIEITAPTNAVKLILNAYRNSEAFAYKVGNNLTSRVSALEKDGLSDTVKEALLICFDKVAWSDSNGRNYYNNLCEAFGIQQWDFSWDASSGQLPTGMTYATEYTPAFADNAVHILRPALVFDNNGGDCEIEVVIKYDSTSNLTANIPQVNIVGETSGSRYFARLVGLNSANSNNIQGLCDNNGYIDTGVNQFDFHKLNVSLRNGIYTLKVDDVTIGTGQGKDLASSNALPTGLYSQGSARAYVYIRSIKYKLLSA